jgi:hypothetical protein
MPMLKTFPVRDSVEGVVEVRMELAEAMDTYGDRARAGILVTLVALALAMVSVLPGSYEVARTAVDFLQGEQDLTLEWLLASTAQLVLAILVWALGLTLVLFLVQSRRFLAFTRARYELFERMGSEVPPSDGECCKPPVEGEEGQVKDPAQVLMSLVREVEGYSSQLDKLHKYTAAFTAMLLTLFGMEVGLALVGLATVEGPWLLGVVSLQVFTSVLLVIVLGLMLEVGRFLMYVRGRHAALEAFELTPPCLVPPGPDAVVRYMRCLSATGDVEGWEEAAPRPVEVEGTGGRRHAFDAVAGSGASRVLVRAFATTPTMGDVRALREAAEDVARHDGTLPLRVVALVEEGDADVPDEVYELLLSSPLMDARGERSRTVQVVSECEGYYCPVPFVAPGS